jgi:hypothetical protein
MKKCIATAVIIIATQMPISVSWAQGRAAATADQGNGAGSSTSSGTHGATGHNPKAKNTSQNNK